MNSLYEFMTDQSFRDLSSIRLPLDGSRLLLYLKWTAELKGCHQLLGLRVQKPHQSSGGVSSSLSSGSMCRHYEELLCFYTILPEQHASVISNLIWNHFIEDSYACCPPLIILRLHPSLCCCCLSACCQCHFKDLQWNDNPLFAGSNWLFIKLIPHVPVPVAVPLQ